MKTRLLLFTLILPLMIFGQKSKPIDDIYFAPSDAREVLKNNVERKVNPKPNYKNGIKEITFIERNVSEINDTDSLVLIAQANDSTENMNNEEGYYLNGFNGSESDLEYATRIRRYHSPKNRIFIGSSSYNDIYFLNGSDWNVYIDDAYAYVTPTWSNPAWFNYNYMPYSYNNWGWGNNWYSPYSMYGYNSWYSPWGYNSFYGGWNSYYGYNGYYGYGNYGYNNWYNPYYGYDGYYGYGGYGGGHYTSNNQNYNDTYRRANNSANTRSMDNNYSNRQGSSTTIGGGGSRSSIRNNYTAVGNEGRSISNSTGTRSINSYPNLNSRSGVNSGTDRSVNTRNSSAYNSTYTDRNARNTTNIDRNARNTTNIDTRGRTGNTNSNSVNGVTRGEYNQPASSGRSSSTYNSYSPRTNTQPSTNSNAGSRSYNSSSNSAPRTSYSTGTPTSTRSSQSTYSAPTRSSSTYTPSSESRSSSTYSSPSSSSGSSYSGGSSSSSSGSSSSGGGGGGGSRR